MRAWINRVLAAILAVLLCFGPALSASAEVLEESRTVDYGYVNEISSTVGHIAATNGREWKLGLANNEKEFALKVQTQADKIKDGEGAWTIVNGVATSGTFTMADDEYYREIVFTVTRTIFGEEKDHEHRVRVYRSPYEASFDGAIKVMSDGSKQLEVTLNYTPGAQLSALLLLLEFDSSQLQPADVQNKVTSSFNKAVDHVGFGGDEAAMKCDISTVAAKKVHIGASRSTTAISKGIYYTVPADGVVLRLRFRLMSESAGIASLSFGTYSPASVGSVPYPAFDVDEVIPEHLRIPNGLTVFPIASPSRAKIVGRPVSNLTLPDTAQVVMGGKMSLNKTGPNPVYYGGEEIKVDAESDSGYRFAYWEAAKSVPMTEEERYRPYLVFKATDGLDLSSVRPVFKKMEVKLESGTELSFKDPYLGEKILIYNRLGADPQRPVGRFSTASSTTQLEAEESYAIAESNAGLQGIDENGLGYTDLQEELLPTEGQEQEPMNILTNGTPTVGETRQFKARDSRASQTDAQNGWSEIPFTLKQTRESEQGKIYLWLADDASWQPVNISDENLAELADSFIESYNTLSTQFYPVLDADGNGGLNILLYDIRDSFTSGGGSYVAGFVNGNELYRVTSGGATIGNAGMDVLHLDSYPQLGYGAAGGVSPEALERTKSTMAHETQHLSLSSSYQSASRVVQYGPPTWVNEGLSLLMEHEMFGTRQERINYYNSVQRSMGNGFDFTQWKGDTLSCYAMSYLFFTYLAAQGGGAKQVATAFYTDYTEYDQDNKLGSVERVLSNIDAFQGLTVDQVFENFYLALLLNEEGLYGFSGLAEVKDFDALTPRVLTSLPSAVNGGGAVIVESLGSFSPTVNDVSELQYVGIKAVEPLYTLEVTQADGGTVEIDNPLPKYEKYSKVTLTAEPDYGYAFEGWIGAENSTSNPLQVRMDSDKAVAPEFRELVTYELKVAVSNGSEPVNDAKVEVRDSSGGLIPSLSAIPAGTEVKITIKPGKGQRFTAWEDDLGIKTNPRTVVMDGNKTLTALVAPVVEWNVAITYDARLGDITVLDAVGKEILPTTNGDKRTYKVPVANETITVKATPKADNYTLGTWGNATLNATQTQTLPMNIDWVLTPKFRVKEEITAQKLLRFTAEGKEIAPTITYNESKITAVAAGQGQIEIIPLDAAVAENGSLMEGTRVRVTVTPTDGRAFIGWGITRDNLPVSTLNAETLNMLDIQVIPESRAVLPEQGNSSKYRTLELTLHKSIRLEAQFGVPDEKSAVQLATLLVNVSSETGGKSARNLLQRDAQLTQGFDSAVKDYDISMVSAESTVYITPVLDDATNSNCVGEVQLLRGNQPYGEAREIGNRSSSVADAAEFEAMAIENVQNGDVIRIQLWNGTAKPADEGCVTYSITIQRSTRDTDPCGAVYFESAMDAVTKGEGLKVALGYMRCESIDITLKAKPGALEAVAVPEEAAGSSGYRVTKTMLTHTPTAEEPYDGWTITVEKANELEPPVKLTELSTVVTVPLKQKGTPTETVWYEKTAVVSLVDTALGSTSDVEVRALDKSAVRGVITVAGQGTPEVTLTKHADGGALTPTMSLKKIDADSSGATRYLFWLDGVEQNVSYDMVIGKEYYTKVRIQELSLAQVLTNFPEHTDARLHKLQIYAGDVDNDGVVGMGDWSQLAGLALGHEVTGAADPLARYDLDGNGRIQMTDLEQLTERGCLGKRDITIIF